MLTLEERERAAYISGDLVLAEALGEKLDEWQELRDDLECLEEENELLRRENDRLQDELGEP